MGVWVNRHFHELLVAVQVVSAPMEGSLAILTKITNAHTF